MEILSSLLQGKNIDISAQYSVAFLKAADIEDIVIMLNNPKVHEYLFFAGEGQDDTYRGYFTPIAESLAEAMKNQTKPENIVLSVRDNQKQAFVGTIGAVKVDFIDGVYELGYQIKEEYWNKGITTKAAQFLMDILEKNYLIHKIQIDFYGQNKASEKVAQKLGFIKEGQLINYYKTSKGFDDKIIYGYYC